MIWTSIIDVSQIVRLLQNFTMKTCLKIFLFSLFISNLLFWGDLEGAQCSQITVSLAGANLNKSENYWKILQQHQLIKWPKICSIKFCRKIGIFFSYKIQFFLIFILHQSKFLLSHLKNCLLWSKSCITMFTFRSAFNKYILGWKGGFKLMQIMGLLGMYFDAALVLVKTLSL